MYRIGSLFTGTGALDLAVMDVFDAEVIWHSQYEPPDKNGKEDTNQYAARILARHWPTTPNFGDITKIDWRAVLDEHGPVDIVTGGFPCGDVSFAGRRVGLTPDTRSGLWTHMAYAISILNPRLVIIENVEGLLSAPADRGLGLDAEALEEEARAGRILRALGAVLGDLAALGFHAEWERVGADGVGAPHRRRRIIIYAWPADADPSGLGRRDRPRILSGLGTARRDTEATADPANLGHQRSRDTRRWRHGPADSGLTAADAQGTGRQGPRPESTRNRPERSGAPAADAQGDGRIERRPEPAGQQRRPDAAQRGGTAPPGVDQSGRRANILQLRPGQTDLDWGDYELAIRRWERILGRPAPWPTDALGRLSPVFTEWLMGLPDGWVTDTPGLTRPAMLRALGNGVVRQQAAAAIKLLHARAIEGDGEAAA
ncbi:DNA cytosine methyltransferase [Streptomyces abikoensis]|uniref:DNA cytosine methyltransferase n=1 Tax=Streptomyces abikoensis TaxID=97398 RepID=A0ABW7TA04_9ACTN